MYSNCIVTAKNLFLLYHGNSSPQVPQPNVTLIGDIVTVNSQVILRCTITLDQSVDCTQVTVNLEVISGAVVPVSTCSYDFTFSADMSNAGSYIPVQCYHHPQQSLCGLPSPVISEMLPSLLLVSACNITHVCVLFCI